ncbi:phospholipase A [Variovorax sp. HJSM1_2]|uniref:phospholipase A n=1 Tax=Variovorax sp. HJSM1_2 TaxID=3366263 RepID=UPI003BE539C0
MAGLTSLAGLACGSAWLVCATPAAAQTSSSATQAPWEICTNMTSDNTARLACFDLWAKEQQKAAAAVTLPRATAAAPAPGTPAPVVPAVSAAALASATPKETPPVDTALPATRIIGAGSGLTGCRNMDYSDLSRFWELESSTDCGVYGIRGFRPLNVSLSMADGVNTQPTSETPDRNATTATDYQRAEARIQLSVRTKMAQSIFTSDDAAKRDSLWFAYSQQSNWQVFNSELSRPFRTTDHEPEAIYVYPTTLDLFGSMKLRYTGLGLVHQSNGQSKPLSRSWNRAYIMAGMENSSRVRITGRYWHRFSESPEDDDNPGISDYIGRAELSAFWNPNRDNTLGVTLRHSLRSDARGSFRLEWLKALGTGTNPDSALRLHTQFFSGYGDSLIDYNKRRNVFLIGLSLVDF